MECTIRQLAEEDLAALLSLYAFLHPDESPLTVNDTTGELWNAICNDSRYIYLGAFNDGTLIAVCNVTIIRNLTRGGRPYAVVENVVTHPGYRRRGYGKRIIKRIIDECKERNCYKIMLLSNSRRTDAHAFYRVLGFDGEAKKAFVLTF